MVEDRGYEETLAAVSQLKPWNPLSKLVREEIARQAPNSLADLEAIPTLHDLDLQLVVLGSGAPALEDAVRRLARAVPDRVAVHLGFDEPLAHLIEAGADAFLMPSEYEPCGLNQMYSQVYGTVPVVSRAHDAWIRIGCPRRIEGIILNPVEVVARIAIAGDFTAERIQLRYVSSG